MTATSPPERRVATEAEARALASVVRLQILRMTLDSPMTNKEIAGRLGRHPASVLHHVRTLVETGFLAALPPRKGVRGAREIPYQATRKSWYVTHPDPHVGSRALIDAFVAESAAPAAQLARLARLGLRLTDEELDELGARIDDLVEDYGRRPASPGGRPYSLFVALHADASRQ